MLKEKVPLKPVVGATPEDQHHLATYMKKIFLDCKKDVFSELENS